jgi:hypothetical protein
MLSTLAALTLSFMPGACNGNIAEITVRPPTTRFANRSLVGLHVKDARACAEEFGWKFRVARRNGCTLPLSADRRTDRVNVTVYQGQVLYAYVG